MSAPSLKPSLRHSVSEWHSNNQQLSGTAQHERHVSHEIRQEARTLRNETRCKVGPLEGGDCGSVGRVVILSSESCGMDSSFFLPHVDVPLGKALNLKLPTDLRIGV
ncbi:hypothetical protein CRENBAI_022097 [Crenichthys baileyi]|uniref:Uncharacterized protein n=1 Tax=Crenichthys baileyi TaxID=28760 RepID=A0AAV9QTC0_9TELE